MANDESTEKVAQARQAVTLRQLELSHLPQNVSRVRWLAALERYQCALDALADEKYTARYGSELGLPWRLGQPE